MFTEPLVEFCPLLLSLFLLLPILVLLLLPKLRLLPLPLLLLSLPLLLFKSSLLLLVDEITSVLLAPVGVKAIPVRVVGAHYPFGFIQTGGTLVGSSIIEIFAVGQAVVSSTLIAWAIILPLGSEEVEPVVKGVHIQEPVPLHPVAAGANVRQVLLTGGCAEPSFQRQAILLGKPYLLGREEVLF